MKYYIYFINSTGYKFYYHGAGFSKNINRALLYDHKADAYMTRGELNYIYHESIFEIGELDEYQR